MKIREIRVPPPKKNKKKTQKELPRPRHLYFLAADIAEIDLIRGEIALSIGHFVR